MAIVPLLHHRLLPPTPVSSLIQHRRMKLETRPLNHSLVMCSTRDGKKGVHQGIIFHTTHIVAILEATSPNDSTVVVIKVTTNILRGRQVFGFGPNYFPVGVVFQRMVPKFITI